MAENLFRQARKLLDRKDNGAELTEEEQLIVSAALIPLNLRDCPLPDDISIGEALDELARMVDGE